MKQLGVYILMTKEEFKNYIENIKTNIIFKNIQQHHTYEPSYDNFNGNNHLQMMKSMGDYHINNKGMSCIAQHVSVFPDGMICIGRPFTKTGGGFLGGQNNNGITLEHIGNFDKGGDIMSDKQRDSILFVVATLCHSFNIKPSVITLPYHCWVNKSKTCPSHNFFGGNTKESANKYFIPLVKAEIDKIYNINPIPVQVNNQVNTKKSSTTQVKQNVQDSTSINISLTYEQALKLVADKINTNYEFWYKKNIKYFDKFIIKVAQCGLNELDKNRINLVITFDDSLKIICDKAKLDFNYWKKQQFCDSSFPALIIKIAKSMK